MPDLTDEEQNAEWNCRLEERLGILCGAAKPTPEQRKIAFDEANAALLILTNGEWVPF